MANPILDLIGESDARTAHELGYYQAQVTGIDSTTGQVYVQQIDDEDELPDEAPYTCLRGFTPEIGDWVMMARWGRSAVCLGVLQRNAVPWMFQLPSGQMIAWVDYDPNGWLWGKTGSLVLRTAGLPTSRNSFLYIKTTDDNTPYGWINPHDAPRSRSIRQLLTYAGASLITSFTRYGFPDDPTIVASATSNNDSGTGNWLQHNTSSVSANVSSVVGGANSATHLEWNPMVDMAVKSGATITLVRHWWGLFSATPSGFADPAISAIGVRFDTSAGDTNLMAYCNDGVGGGTILDTGIAVNASTAYEIKLDVQDDLVDFYISGAFVGRITTNLPAASTALTYGLYCTTLSAAARSLRWGRVSIESEP